MSEQKVSRNAVFVFLVKILFNHVAVSDIAVLLLSHKVSLQFVYQVVVMQSFRIQRENTLQYPMRQYKDEHEQFKHEVAVILKPKVSRKLNCCVEFSVVDCRDNTNKVISHRAVIEREKSIMLSFIYLVVRLHRVPAEIALTLLALTVLSLSLFSFLGRRLYS